MSNEQPMRDKNIAALIAYFKSGITENSGELGIELEHTIVTSDDLNPVSYGQEHGVLYLLHQLLPEYPETTYDSEGDLLGVARPGEAVTLEPAAQLELSAGPFKSLKKAQECFEAFEDKLEEILTPLGEKALLVGYHPSAKATELKLIPKRRYKFMNLYLGEISSYGPCMMRGSASTQVSIDYSSVDDCLRKLRLAFALVPLFSLITDNAAIFEGKPRERKMVRTKIWQKCDPDRCELIPGVMEADFSLEKYANYILDTPAILVHCKNHEWCYTEKTFGQIYANTAMDKAAVEHALSMFFNDVRLKTYIEIRPADAMPVPYAIAYAALIKGLFYSTDNLDKLDKLFGNINQGDIEDAKNRLMEAGYDAEIYGKPVSELCDIIIALGSEGLSEDERPFLTPLKELISRRTTLADIRENAE